MSNEFVFMPVDDGVAFAVRADSEADAKEFVRARGASSYFEFRGELGEIDNVPAWNSTRTYRCTLCHSTADRGVRPAVCPECGAEFTLTTWKDIRGPGGGR